MNKTISLLCPTRGRPERFAAMVESAFKHAHLGTLLEVLAYVDNDDAAPYVFGDRARVYALRGERIPVPCAVNVLAGKAGGEILAMVGDDVLFRTPGWDELVCRHFDRFQDGLVIASPDNGDGKQRVNHWFTGRGWLDLFGHLLPPVFEHFCADNWVQDVAAPCGRLVYMPDVLLEHMHTKYNKGPNDDTYRAKRGLRADGTDMSGRDNVVYQRLAPERAADVERLKRAIAGATLAAA